MFVLGWWTNLHYRLHAGRFGRWFLVRVPDHIVCDITGGNPSAAWSWNPPRSVAPWGDGQNTCDWSEKLHPCLYSDTLMKCHRRSMPVTIFTQSKSNKSVYVILLFFKIRWHIEAKLSSNIDFSLDDENLSGETHLTTDSHGCLGSLTKAKGANSFTSQFSKVALLCTGHSVDDRVHTEHTHTNGTNTHSHIEIKWRKFRETSAETVWTPWTAGWTSSSYCDEQMNHVCMICDWSKLWYLQLLADDTENINSKSRVMDTTLVDISTGDLAAAIQADGRLDTSW